MGAFEEMGDEEGGDDGRSKLIGGLGLVEWAGEAVGGGMGIVCETTDGVTAKVIFEEENEL